MPNSDDQLTSKRLLYDYHAAFYKLMHLPLDWMPPTDRTFTVCGKEHCNPLCARIMETFEGATLCTKLSRERARQARETGRTVEGECHAGLYDALIPIQVDGEYLGALCIGQYMLEAPTEEKLKRIAERLSFLHLAPGELWEYFRHTRVLTAEEHEGLLDLVRMLGQYICESRGRLRFLESLAGSDPIKAAERYIQAHFDQRLTVDGIARSVGMSKSNFLHRFAEQTGTSPLAYLNSYRVERAIELLRATRLPVAEIAAACGFRSISPFNRQFRKVTGKAPGDYRRPDDTPVV